LGDVVPNAILDGHLPIIFGPDLGCDSPQIPRLAWGSLLVFQCFGALCIVDQLIRGGMCLAVIVLVACAIDGTGVTGRSPTTVAFGGQKVVCMYRAPEKPYARISVNALDFLGAPIPKKPHNIEHAKAVKPCWGLLMLVRYVLYATILLDIRAPSYLPPAHDPSYLPPVDDLTYLPPVDDLTYLQPAIHSSGHPPTQRFFSRTILGPLVEVCWSQTTACIDRSRIGR